MFRLLMIVLIVSGAVACQKSQTPAPTSNQDSAKDKTPSGTGSQKSPLATIGLIEAAKTANYGQVKAHIVHQSKLDLVDDNGMTALDYAAMNDDIKMYKLLMDTGVFKPTKKLAFLHKHVLADVKTIFSEAFSMVALDGGSVVLLDKPSVTKVSNSVETAKHVDQLAKQLENLDQKQQRELLMNVVKLWKLDTKKLTQRGYVRLEDDLLVPNASPIATALIVESAKQGPVIRQYLKTYRENPFMMQVLIIAAEIAAQSDKPKKPAPKQ